MNYRLAKATKHNMTEMKMCKEVVEVRELKESDMGVSNCGFL